MSDSEDFELFKKQYKGSSRDAVLHLSHTWQQQCQLITAAYSKCETGNMTLLAVNDFLLEVIKSNGLGDKLTPEALQPYIENRAKEFSEGRIIIANSINKHAELHLHESRAATARQAGEESGKRRADDLKQRNDEIKCARDKLLHQGRASHEVASMLALRFNLSPKQIREILKQD